MDTKIGKLLQTTQHSIKKWHFHITGEGIIILLEHSVCLLHR